MPACRDITVSIRVDDKVLPEFAVENDVEKNAVSCWIPSEIDKEISVIVSNRYNADLYATLVIDGVRATGKTVHCMEDRDVGFFSESTYVERKLKFAKAELVDDDDLLASARASDAGSIKITLVTFRYIGWTTTPRHNALPENKVHEKAKKGVTDCIAVGPPIVNRKSAKRKTFEKLETICTFTFRYRPLGFLQAQGIAPPARPDPAQHEEESLEPPSQPNGPVACTGDLNAVKPEHEAEDVDEDDTELQALLARVDEIRARKRKNDDGVGAPRKKVKTEPQLTITPGEVIDLT